MFLAFVANPNLRVYHKDVKSAFQKSELVKEVYVEQSHGFIDPEFEDFVYLHFKTLYGLK